MHVKNIKLINYRNYENLYVELNKKTNIFIGKNAQGKTNLLEAIYICARGRSFRTNRDREIINLDKDQAYVGANMNIGDFDKLIEIKMERSKIKRIKVNNRELKNYKELYSGLHVVIFSPEDLNLVKGGPSERRSFLNAEISQIRPVYHHNISRYNKVLFQRNNALKSAKFKKNISSILDVFDLQLISLGSDIIVERKKYVDELSIISKRIHKVTTSNSEDLTLKYTSNIDIYEDKKEMEKYYLEKLKENLAKDIETTTTEFGPHRDDIEMDINGKDLKIFGSQGQQRTVVLSIKLSEVELINRQVGNYPVLLLDDVFSELDEERRKYLVKSFKDMQTIITVTDAVDLNDLSDIDYNVFYIEDGKLKLEEGYDITHRRK